MNFRDLAAKTERYIIERRRYYHAHPELSQEEKETTNAIVKDLEEMGLEPVRFKTSYGCYAYIRGGHPGKTVALRADIDALPILEETGLEFASQNPGCMHACGHDSHIATLLGAAKMLCEVKDELYGNVKLLFQPAEETGYGAKSVIEEGFLDDVDAIYGCHTWGKVESPYINIEPGERMASTAQFIVTVNGVSAHGSAPHLGVDAIVAASSMIMNLQTYVSRNSNPLDPLVVTVGTIHGGSRWNVIPNKVVFDGTVRTFSQELVDNFEKDLKRICDNTAAALGCTTDTEINWYAIPVVNDKDDLNRIARNAVVKLYGEDALVEMPKEMGGEDFSFYMKEVPGVFAFLGSRNVEKGLIYTNHQEQYTVDEDALKRGSAVYAQFAYDFLEENK